MNDTAVRYTFVNGGPGLQLVHLLEVGLLKTGQLLDATFHLEPVIPADLTYKHSSPLDTQVCAVRCDSEDSRKRERAMAVTLLNRERVISAKIDDDTTSKIWNRYINELGARGRFVDYNEALNAILVRGSEEWIRDLWARWDTLK